MWKYSVCFLMPGLVASVFDLDGLGSVVARVGLALALMTITASILSTALFRGANLPRSKRSHG
ncbi:hypothetical protein [Zavarzinella formosa]|uniref:hypothetical protein n=1 Tax=Zavarzinella formosa TaxID=360055 RepID=UPI00031D58CA|nr:hypothetical protein [Zavarzinella formosa]